MFELLVATVAAHIGALVLGVGSLYACRADEHTVDGMRIV